MDDRDAKEDSNKGQPILKTTNAKDYQDKGRKGVQKLYKAELNITGKYETKQRQYTIIKNAMISASLSHFKLAEKKIAASSY